MRARNLKPDFFKNEVLAGLPDKAKLLFIGLWCLADREGRLEDRPKRIEAEIFPYQKVDVDRLLTILSSTKDPFVKRYEANGIFYLEISNFSKHQRPHPRELPSKIPKAVKSHGKAVEINGDTRPLAVSPSPLAVSPLSHCGSIAVDTAKPYPLPNPKANPKGCLVLSYKIAKGFRHDDRDWDKANFSRGMAAAGILLGLCKDLASAEACLKDMGCEYDAKPLSWTLETVARNAGEWLKKNGRTDANASRAGLRMAIAKQSAERHGEGDLVKASEGPIPCAVRDSKNYEHQNE
jgi:hypothetical protein